MHNLGRPVLVGTTTIEKSELLAAFLSEYKIPYRILNARVENVAIEAEIVAEPKPTVSWYFPDGKSVTESGKGSIEFEDGV